MSSSLNYTYRRLSFNVPIGTTDLDLYTGNFNYIYREDTNSTDVSIRLNSRSESLIALRSQTAIDVGSGGADKLILEVTSAVAFTLVLIIGDSEKSNDLTGVSIRRDSTETTVTGTIDVDIVAQTLPVLNENIAQIGGSTTPVTDLTTILGATNPSNTSFRGWSYLNTGTAVLATNTSGNDVYVTAVSANAFGLTSVDNTIFLGLYDATPSLVANFIAFTFNYATPGGALEDGTYGYSMSFPVGIKVENNFSIRLVGGANTWSSGSVWGHTS